LAVASGKDAVTHEHCPAIFQTPHRPLTHQNALVATHTRGINVLEPLRIREFELRRPTPRRFFPPAAASPLLLCGDAVGSGRCFGARCASTALDSHFGLILRQPLDEAANSPLQPPNGLPLFSGIGLELVDARFQAGDDGIALAASVAAGNVHTASIGNLPARSCACFPSFLRISKIGTRVPASGRMDGYLF